MYFNLGSTICIFLFEIVNNQSKEDNRIWVISGDLPKMYLDTFGPQSIKEVLDDYSDLAEEWADNIIAKKSIKNCFPFEAKPTIELAGMLKQRVHFIRNTILKNTTDIRL